MSSPHFVRVGVLELKSTQGPPRSYDALVKVEVKVFGGPSQTDETRVARASAQPKWNAVFDFVVEPDVLADTIVIFKVWDMRGVGRVFLGQVAVPLSELPADTSYDSPDALATYPLETPRVKEQTVRYLKVRIGMVTGEALAASIVKPSTPVGAGTRSSDEETWQMIDESTSASSASSSKTNTLLSSHLRIPTHNNGDSEAPSKDDINEWTDVATDETAPMVVMGIFPGKIKSTSAPTQPTAAPAQIASSRVAGLLKLNVLRVAHFGRELDAFTVISFGTNSFRSKVCRQGRKGRDWQETLVLVIKEAERHRSIKLSVYERSKFTMANALIAHCFVHIEDLIMLPDTGEEAHMDLTIDVQDGTNKPILCVRSSFMPFTTMTRTFWTNLADRFGQVYTGEESIKLTKADLWQMLQSLEINFPEEALTPLLDTVAANDDPQNAGVLMSELLETDGALTHIFSSTLEQLLLSDEGTDQAVRLIISPNDKTGRQSEADAFMLGGFPTESYAQKGWFSRLLTNLTNGTYDIGKDNANVLVFDRASGQLIDEKIPMYIRLGIRAVYRSRLGTLRRGLDSKPIRAFLASQTVKQGKKFDDPESVDYIQPFIKFHEISMHDVLEPIESFKTFNQFFYRKLRPGARTVASADPNVAVSPADCRVMVFPTVQEATRLWIKGKEFTLERLLQNKKMADFFEGGSIAVCRLAPQDYHRFHCPVDGIMGKARPIDGTYYTVNPMAVRERDVDVFTENKRTVATIVSPQFGKMAYVLVGAMLVGSIIITASQNAQLHRLDEIGYFAFGGSTVICIFQKGVMQFDADLEANSARQLETLVRVGNSLGRSIRQASSSTSPSRDVSFD